MSVKIISVNKKASFEYALLEKFEAGIELRGSEVKSVRAGRIQLKDSYVGFRKEEAYLQKAHISTYSAASMNNHNPERARKLLLHQHELEKIFGSIQKGGQTCVPVRVYLKNGKVKVEIALARGKKKWDKRQDEKKKTHNKEMHRQLRRR